jgi:hypothetical protein
VVSRGIPADAYSARVWLAEQPDVNAGHIAVMGIPLYGGGPDEIALLRSAERSVSGRVGCVVSLNVQPIG